MSWLLALWQILARFARWLVERPGRIVALAAIGGMTWHLVIVDPGLRADRAAAIGARDQARAERDAEISAHTLTKQTYRLAQQQAAALDAARVARVEAEQREITDEVTADYRARLADARAAAERLRQQLARAREHPAGAAGGEQLPATGDTAIRAAEAAGDRRLSLDAEELDWRLTATEQAIQLDALIDWVEAQAGVR